MDNELKIQKDLLYKLSKQVPGFLYQYRLHPDGRSYVPYSSYQILDMFEVTPQDLENAKVDAAHLFAKIHPDDIEGVMQDIMKSFESLEELNLYFRIQLEKKGERWIHAQANPEKLEDESVLWHAYARDITQEKKIKQALSASEERWKFALEGAKDGVWDWNLETNDVFYSKQWKAMLGYQDHEIHGSFEDWESRVHPDDLEKCYADIQKHINGKTDMYSNIHRILCKDGSYKWILDRGKIFVDETNGKRMVGTHTDLTDRMEIEHKLKEKNKELEQFAYITSHDLQEPLNSIISFSNLLKESDSQLDDIGKKSVDIMEKMSYRMKDFIVDLLEYSRIGKQKEITASSINSIIDNLKIDLNSLLQKNEAIINYEGEDINITCVKEEIIKVLQNLIVNGIKYQTPNNKPVITIEAKEKDTEVLISVKDNGIGIEKKYHSKIFDVFQRLHSRNTYEGTGIGLAYCKKVIEMHGGKIWLDSELGRGSIFYFTISKS